MQKLSRYLDSHGCHRLEISPPTQFINNGEIYEISIVQPVIDLYTIISSFRVKVWLSAGMHCSHIVNSLYFQGQQGMYWCIKVNGTAATPPMWSSASECVAKIQKAQIFRLLWTIAQAVSRQRARGTAAIPLTFKENYEAIKKPKITVPHSSSQPLTKNVTYQLQWLDVMFFAHFPVCSLPDPDSKCIYVETHF